MIFLKLLLISSGLMFIPQTASIHKKLSLCYQPSKYIKPIHYDIKLITYVEGRIFYGEYNISISIFNKTRHIFLQSGKFSIQDIVLFKNIEKMIMRKNDHENDKYTVHNSTYNIKEDTVIILFINELSPGNYILNIKYHGTADEVFRIYDVKGKIAWITAIHFHTVDPQKRFSCGDQQNLLLEATFNISIGCNQCTVLSNMPLRNKVENEDNILWTHFATTSAMSPYLVRMIVSNFLSRIDNDNRNIEMWCSNKYGFHMKFAKNFAENITLFLKNEWNSRSNITLKVTHVAIPNFHDNDIIDFGFVLYKDTDIIYDKNVYPIAKKIEIAQLVGRKVTQQWFYNMLSNPLVPGFWFKKGFTTLLATYAVKMTYPDYQIGNLLVVQNQHYSFNLDSGYYMWNSTLQDNSSSDIPNSIRAFFILRMIELSLEKSSSNNIGSYANSTLSHRLDSVNFMKDIYLKIRENIAPQLTSMENWAVEKHCPFIKVERNYTDPMSQTTVSIQYIDILAIYQIPITFTTQTSPDFNNFTHHFLYAFEDFKLLLPFKEYGWMIFNIQRVGYYRVNYDNENWGRISNYLNSDNYMKIHVLNRAQIIDDAFNLMISGELKFGIFSNIIQYLYREEDYLAWYPMFKAMEYIFSTFPAALLEDYIWSFKTVVKLALHEVLKRIKYEEIDDSDDLRKCLRQEAARWACFLDDATCKLEANNKLQQHTDGYKIVKRLLPWWQEWTYCKGLMLVTREENVTWVIVYHIGLKKLDTKFLEYLACSEDTNVIKSYLTIEQNIPKEQKYPNSFNNFLHIITKHAKNRIILRYILHDFLKIKPKHVDITAAFIIIINNVYSVKLTQEINRYVQGLRVNVKEIVRMKEKDFIMLNSDKIESKISIRNTQIERRRQYLENIFY